MAPAQSPPVPASGTKPRLADWGWLLAYGLRGLAELVRARLVFARLKAADIPHRNRTAALAARAAGRVTADGMVARIGYVLPRISARLPWRSDCLVQAIAAQNWLAAKGLVSDIRIGVERPETTGFAAHAWLVHGEQVVTGGDIARYHLLLAENPGEPAAP
jgi:Transglutaminase-like superfamily